MKWIIRRIGWNAFTARSLGEFFYPSGLPYLWAYPILAIGINYLQSYGWGVFVGIPFMLGLIATLLHAVHQRRTFWECISVALSACALFGACVFFLAMEGIICLIMASVIVVPLSCLGALAGFGIQSSHHASRVPPVLLLSCLLLMGFEKMENPKPVPYSVTSMVEVDAPPEVVWSHVVSFSELPPVEDWIFKTGLAYPLRAEIEGEGWAPYGIVCFPPVHLWSPSPFGMSRVIYGLMSRPCPSRCRNGRFIQMYTLRILKGISKPPKVSSCWNAYREPARGCMVPRGITTTYGRRVTGRFGPTT